MKKVRGKKGVSVMIGYVLLIAIAVVMGIIVYNWLQGYTPSERSECPEGVSIGINQIDFVQGESKANISLKNNGRFNIEGFYVRVSNGSGTQANIDISKFYDGVNGSGLAVFNGGQLETGKEKMAQFNFDDSFGKRICLVEIVPARVIQEENRNRILTCSDAIVREEIDCGELPPEDKGDEGDLVSPQEDISVENLIIKNNQGQEVSVVSQGETYRIHSMTKNKGTKTESVRVSLNIYDQYGSFIQNLDSKTTSLQAEETKEIIFTQQANLPQDAYILKANAIMLSGQDENPNNNIKEKSIQVGA